MAELSKQEKEARLKQWRTAQNRKYIHTKGTERYEDLEMDILSGNTIDLEILDFMPDFMSNPQVIGIIEDLIAKFPEVKVLGSLEKWKTI